MNKEPMTVPMIKAWLSNVKQQLVKAEKQYHEQLELEKKVQTEVYKKYRIYLKPSNIQSSNIGIRIRLLRMRKQILEKILGYD